MLKQKRSEEVSWRIDHSLNLWSIELYTSSQFTPLEDFPAALNWRREGLSCKCNNVYEFFQSYSFQRPRRGPFYFPGALRLRHPIPYIFCVFAVV